MQTFNFFLFQCSCIGRYFFQEMNPIHNNREIIDKCRNEENRVQCIHIHDSIQVNLF